MEDQQNPNADIFNGLAQAILAGISAAGGPPANPPVPPAIAVIRNQPGLANTHDLNFTSSGKRLPKQ
jgi:hypothetical protein